MYRIVGGQYFRIKPAEILFSRSMDNQQTTKIVKVESTSREDLFLEAVASNHKLFTAMRSCGKLNYGHVVDIKVNATQKAFEISQKSNVKMFLMVS